MNIYYQDFVILKGGGNSDDLHLIASHGILIKLN